jgi:hypothetical protein
MASYSKLQWGEVHVREYARVVGDHPEVRLGPPLSIGWAYCDRLSQSLDEFESEHSTKRKGVHRLSSVERRDLLHNVFQVPINEARAALEQLEKIRRYHQKSKKEEGKVRQTMQIAVESTRRNLQLKWRLMKPATRAIE